MAVAILDTSIYIDHWERGLYEDTLENLRRPILSGIQQWSCQSFGAALVNATPSNWSPVFLNWPRSGGSLRWPTGGSQEGLSKHQRQASLGHTQASRLSKQCVDCTHCPTLRRNRRYRQ